MLKANPATTYTYSEAHPALDLKANQGSTYTKTKVDNVLAPTTTTAYVDAKSEVHNVFRTGQFNKYIIMVGVLNKAGPYHTLISW